MEVFVVRRCHRFESEVIDDEQGRFGEGLEAALEGGRSSCRVKLSQEFGLRGEEDVVAVSDGDMSERLSDVALSGATGSGDEDGDLFFNKAAGGEVLDLVLVDAEVEVEVEALDRLFTAEASPSQPPGELLVLASCDLILDEERVSSEHP